MFEYFNLPAAFDQIRENKRKKMKTYKITELFYSIQGEGLRTGTANIFIRFAGCNLKCSADDEYAKFSCDTEFTSGVSMTAQNIAEVCSEFSRKVNRNLPIILTGGEPALQIDDALIQTLKGVSGYLAIETNGTKELPDGIDWICVSPKSAEHTLRVPFANELKYVRSLSQGIPKPRTSADNFLISPAFEADGSLKNETLRHCIELVKNNPDWRLSIQTHKFLNIR